MADTTNPPSTAPGVKAYRAYATGHYSTMGDTPRQAAERFFAAWSNKRKCSVTEGTIERHMFVVRIGGGQTLRRWKDITRRTVSTLPTA